MVQIEDTAKHTGNQDWVSVEMQRLDRCMLGSKAEELAPAVAGTTNVSVSASRKIVVSAVWTCPD